MLTILTLLACKAEPTPALDPADPIVTVTPAPTAPLGGTTPPSPTDTCDHSAYLPPGAVELGAEVLLSARSECDSGTAGTLDATAARGTIALARSGPTEGCGCEVRELQAWMLPDEGRITLRWATGSCDGVFCCETTGTVLDVPAGSWTIDEYWGALSTTLTIP